MRHVTPCNVKPHNLHSGWHDNYLPRRPTMLWGRHAHGVIIFQPPWRQWNSPNRWWETERGTLWRGKRVKATDEIKICIWFQPPHGNKTPTFAETAVDVSHKMHIAWQSLSGDNGCDFPIQLEAIKENVQAVVSFLCLFWLQLKTGLMLIYLKKLARVKRYFAKVFTSFPVHILPHGISELAFKLKLMFLSFLFCVIAQVQ